MSLGSQLYVGNTKFQVHVHASLACTKCSLSEDQSNLIPFVTATDGGSKQTVESEDRFEVFGKEEKEQVRRSKMQSLKAQFLATSGSPATTSQSKPKAAFVDRAKQRRSRDGSTATIPPTQETGQNNSLHQSTSASPQPAAADPFSSDSVGARLLSKFGGTDPSTIPERGLGKMIEAKTVGGGSRDSRPGLGSQPLVDAVQDRRTPGQKRSWLEDVREANRKRFRDLQ